MKKPAFPRMTTLADVKRQLVPGGASDHFVKLRRLDVDECEKRWLAYALLSSINSAMRERAEAHRRSTERCGMSSTSEVSAVVKPAK